MKRLPNVHPGEVLREEFLVPTGGSAYRLAKDTALPQTREHAPKLIYIAIFRLYNA